MRQQDNEAERDAQRKKGRSPSTARDKLSASGRLRPPCLLSLSSLVRVADGRDSWLSHPSKHTPESRTNAERARVWCMGGLSSGQRGSVAAQSGKGVRRQACVNGALTATHQPHLTTTLQLASLVQGCGWAIKFLQAGRDVIRIYQRKRVAMRIGTIGSRNTLYKGSRDGLRVTLVTTDAPGTAVIIIIILVLYVTYVVSKCCV